jgi:hypothetical protein
MIPPPPAPTPRRGNGFTIVLTSVIAAYLALTGFAGFHVGHTIAQARTNPFVGIGSQLIGRDATERFAIEQLHVPRVITASPAFWIAMRLSE